jgi:hypothetical protein
MVKRAWSRGIPSSQQVAAFSFVDEVDHHQRHWNSHKLVSPEHFLRLPDSSMPVALMVFELRLLMA